MVKSAAPEGGGRALLEEPRADPCGMVGPRSSPEPAGSPVTVGRWADGDVLFAPCSVLGPVHTQGEEARLDSTLWLITLQRHPFGEATSWSSLPLRTFYNPSFLAIGIAISYSQGIALCLAHSKNE